jgi:hypothetical protein
VVEWKGGREWRDYLLWGSFPVNKLMDRSKKVVSTAQSALAIKWQKFMYTLWIKFCMNKIKPKISNQINR